MGKIKCEFRSGEVEEVLIEDSKCNPRICIPKYRNICAYYQSQRSKKQSPAKKKKAKKKIFSKQATNTKKLHDSSESKKYGQLRRSMEKPQMFYDKTAPLYLETCREQYEEDGNPIHVMRAFIEAVRYKLPIPSWVIEKINEVFQKYLYGEYEYEGNHSLDILMGCKGSGKYPLTKRLDLRRRDVRLMTDMGRLIQLRMKVVDAAEVVYSFNEKSSPPTPERICQMYHTNWKAKIRKIADYTNPRRTRALLRFAPEIFKKKYPDLFKEIN